MTTVILPTLNEEASIRSVIRDFKQEGFQNILVVDGGSDDKTVEIARTERVAVHLQTGNGKGNAVAEAFEICDDDCVILCDADMTYNAGDATELEELILNGGCDHAIAGRTDHYYDAMPDFNQLGNQIFNAAFNTLHGASVDDLLSGFRAFSKDFYKTVEISENGFGVETELTAKTVNSDYRLAQIDSTYHPRPDEPNLHPVKDGAVITKAIVTTRF